jgi:ABC-type enterobactin transport system permease subunit
VSTESGLDTGRLARTLTLVVFVSAVFFLLAASRLSGDVFRIGVVGIGAVAFVTALIGFLIAAGSSYDDPPEYDARPDST